MALSSRLLPVWASILILFPLPTKARQVGERLFEVSASKYLLGTTVELKALCPDILTCKQAFYDAFQEINRIENLLSYSRDSSEVAAINRAAGVEPVKVSQETFAIVLRGTDYANRFGGIFDISIGPVTTLWGFSDDKEIAVPDSQELASRLKLVDYRRIVLNPSDTSAFLAEAGMKLDLGGIGKGYAIDRAAGMLKGEGLQHFIIDAGGDIFAAGYKVAEQNWVVGIQDPRRPKELLATFEGHDLSVATSGDYERYKIIDGQRYHHIIDPRSGFPGTLCQSVTVFASSAEEADVLATYFFIIGADAFAQTKDFSEARACFVEASGDIKYEPSLVTDYHLNFLTNAVASIITRD